MADRAQNPTLNLKRLELRHHEQMLTVRRLELRLLELADEEIKVKEAIEGTKNAIIETKKEIDAQVKI